MRYKQPYADETVNLALDTIGKSKQAIVFANTKSSAEKAAEEIAKKRKIRSESLDALADRALHALSSPTKQCRRLALCLRKGIAFHHAGLAPRQRELVEDAFRERCIAIIAATPTLAAGLDLPAFRVILKDLRRFSQRGLRYIPVLEYKQMAGRAGRPSYDTVGEAVIVASSEDQAEELVERYIEGEPEPIYSKLAVEPVLRTYVLSLIATRFATSRQSLFDFFGRTFWAHQYVDVRKINAIVDRMLALLEEWGFVVGSGKAPADGFTTADALITDGAYRATPLGERVAQLYLDPYTAHLLIDMLGRARSRGWADFGYLHVLSSCLEIRPQLRARVKDMERVQEAVAEHGQGLLIKEPSVYDPDYDEFADAIKTALFFADWIDEQGEERLMQSFAIRPGEIRVKLDIADWLLYCSTELCRLLSYKDLQAPLRRLRLRLKHGVREELLALLQLKGIGRVRARRLFGAKMTDLGALRRADPSSLAQLIGRATAIDVKKQLGQDVKIAKVRKRKGQISLKDY